MHNYTCVHSHNQHTQTRHFPESLFALLVVSFLIKEHVLLEQASIGLQIISVPTLSSGTVRYIPLGVGAEWMLTNESQLVLESKPQQQETEVGVFTKPFHFLTRNFN